MKSKQKITLKLCRAIADDPTEQEIADTELRGFFVRRGKNRISFYVRKKTGGRDREVAIGTYPDVHPDEARRMAISKIAEMSMLSDDLGAHAYRVPTVEDVSEAYIKRLKNPANARSIFLYVRPLYSRKITQVEPKDVIRIKEALADHPHTANLVLKYLSAAINRAIRSSKLNMTNPCLGIEHYKVQPRDRFLTMEEAPRLIEALTALTYQPANGVQAAALLVMLYTGARKMNVLTMRIEEIDNGTWTIPAEKSKNKKEYTVRLNAFAAKIISERIGDRKRGYVFCHGGSEKHMSDVKGTFRKACRMAGIGEVRIHDLRRTLGTWMLSAGEPIEVVSKTLGHSSIRVTEQVYAHMLPNRIADATENAVALMQTNGKKR